MKQLYYFAVLPKTRVQTCCFEMGMDCGSRLKGTAIAIKDLFLITK